MNSCCCQTCVTLYKLRSDFTTQFVRNFYFDFSVSDAYGSQAAPSVAQQAYACDVDAAGNLYQVGTYSGHAIQPVTSSAPMPSQPTAMYTLRSWNSAGDLRWSWSDAPYGTVISSGSDHARFQPVTLSSVRIGPGTVPGMTTAQMVLVGSKVGDQTAGIIANHHYSTIATALDTNGAVLWSVDLYPFEAEVHSAGATRSLWRIKSMRNGSTTVPNVGGWILLRNSDGAILYTSRPTTFLSFGTPTRWTNGCGLAQIDSDDLVYEVTSDWEAFGYLGDKGCSITRVTRYSSDGAVVDWSVVVPFMSGIVYFPGHTPVVDPSQPTGLGPLTSYVPGATFAVYELDRGDLVLEASNVLVSTGIGHVRVRKSDGAHVSARRSPSYRTWVSDSNGIVCRDPSGVVTVYAPNGDRNLKWNGSAVSDVRRTPDGGYIVTVGHDCLSEIPDSSMESDLRTAIITCSTVQTFTAQTVTEFGYENTLHHTGRGQATYSSTNVCVGGCQSLSTAQVEAMTNMYYQAILPGFVIVTGSQGVAGWMTGNVAANIASNPHLASGQPLIVAPSAGGTITFECV